MPVPASAERAAKSEPPKRATPAWPSGPEPAPRAWALSPRGALGFQRKCACGGTCEECRAEDDSPLRIQKQAAGGSQAGPAPTPAGKASGSVVLEDNEAAGPGQMNRSAFLTELRTQLFAICNDELAPAGRSAEGCPYLGYWLARAQTMTAAQIEAGIRRFTGDAGRTARDLLAAAVSRVRAAVRLWVTTGRLSLPEGTPSLAGVAGTVAGAVGGAIQQGVATVSGAVSTIASAGADVLGVFGVQTKAVPGARAGGANMSPAAVRARLTSGRPLDPGIRSRMEHSFGRSFSGVRVHADTAAAGLARGLSARAFTVGQNIAFADGEYRPGSVGGNLLIAHELAHTVQQSGAGPAASGGSIGDQVLEDEADRAAVGVVASEFGMNALRQPAQRTGLRLQGCGRKKPKLDFEHWSAKQREVFVKAHFSAADQPLASAVIEDLFQSAATLDFDDEEELRKEIFKRVRTSQLMQKSQDLFGKAFEYPNKPAAKACRADKQENPRVNKAAQAYWGPVQNAGGTYFFELSPTGRKNGYKALTSLFVPQKSICDMTLIHCDYLASVIHFRAFADSVGEKTFNDLVSTNKIPMTLRWNGFQDLEDIGWSHPSEAVSLQEVRPPSEKDLVIGDHVIFWNHRAYDLINEEIGNAWRLENAILVDRKGGVDNFLGHGSGRHTNEGMRKKLAEEYNDVVGIADGIIKRAKSKDAATASKARAEMASRFPNVQEKDGDWKIEGEKHGKNFDEKLTTITTANTDLTGLKDPEDPSRMGMVKRPIESAPP